MQNLPSCCQLRTERSEATRRGRAGWRGAAGRSTVAREASASSASGRGDMLGLDRHRGRLYLVHDSVPLHDKCLDAAVGRDEKVAQLVAEKVAQGPRAVAIEL